MMRKGKIFVVSPKIGVNHFPYRIEENFCGVKFLWFCQKRFVNHINSLSFVYYFSKPQKLYPTEIILYTVFFSLNHKTHKILPQNILSTVVQFLRGLHFGGGVLIYSSPTNLLFSKMTALLTLPLGYADELMTNICSWSNPCCKNNNNNLNNTINNNKNIKPATIETL